MTKGIRVGVLALLGLLFIAQAFRIDKTNPPVESDVVAAAEVKAILRRACYDCHSSETVWPWYSNVAPVSWLLARDVNEGRAELNFSTWDRYAETKRRKKLKETAKEVAEGEMPPWYYVAMHPEASLTPAERAVLLAWAKDGLAKDIP